MAILFCLVVHIVFMIQLSRQQDHASYLVPVHASQFPPSTDNPAFDNDDAKSIRNNTQASDHSYPWFPQSGHQRRLLTIQPEIVTVYPSIPFQFPKQPLSKSQVQDMCSFGGTLVETEIGKSWTAISHSEVQKALFGALRKQLNYVERARTESRKDQLKKHCRSYSKRLIGMIQRLEEYLTKMAEKDEQREAVLKLAIASARDLVILLRCSPRKRLTGST